MSKFKFSRKYIFMTINRSFQTCNNTFSDRAWTKKSIKFNYNFKFRNVGVGADDYHLLKNSDSEKLNIVSADLIQQNKNRIRWRKQKSFVYHPKGEILYGLHPVYLALLQHKRKFYQIFLKQGFLSCDDPEKRNLRQKIKEISHSLAIPMEDNLTSWDLNHIAPNAVHQGICVDASSYPIVEYSETDSENDVSSDLPIWLVLDKVQDPMNIGAIIRSAYYFGIDKVFIGAENSCKLSPTVSKASSGALEVITVYKVCNFFAFLERLQRKGWDIVSTEVNKQSVEARANSILDLCDFQVTKPTVVIFGNEGVGISPSLIPLCNYFVSIHPRHPLHPGVDSLNVSVAAGILLYHMLYTKKSTS